MTKYLTKCPDCGSETFFVYEEVGYKASIDPKTGVLETYSTKHNEITSISCADCGSEFVFSDFEEVLISN